MFKEAEKMALILDINICVKRLNKRQQNRPNPFSGVNSMNPEDYYKITIAIPCIDSFISNLKERFLSHKNIFEGFRCLFSDEIEYDSFEELVKFYLDSEIQTVIAELRIWQSKLKVDNKNPKARDHFHNRLNGLTLLAVHREIPIDAKEVLDVMSQKSKKLDTIL
ncbi:hypothetical protein QTP88_022179 [Uroleucon formosanum]